MIARKYLIMGIVSILSVFPCMGMSKLMSATAARKAEASKKTVDLSVRITFKNELLEQDVRDPKSAKVKLTLPGSAHAGKDLSIVLPFALKDYSFSWFPHKALLGVSLLDQGCSLSYLEVVINGGTGLVILKKNAQGRSMLVAQARQKSDEESGQLRDQPLPSIESPEVAKDRELMMQCLNWAKAGTD